MSGGEIRVRSSLGCKTGTRNDPVIERRRPIFSAAQTASDTILVGTVDGVALLAKSSRGWTVKHRALQGVFVSGVTALEDGTLFASTRGVGMARSDDGGVKWSWVNDGLAHHEFWSTPRRPPAGPRRGVRRRVAGASLRQRGQGQVLARAARRFATPRRCRNGPFRRRRASATSRTSCSTATGCGSASRSARCRYSDDFGESFTELPVDPDPRECDIHRILVHPARPEPHHHRQRHRRHDGERGRRQELCSG